MCDLSDFSLFDVGEECEGVWLTTCWSGMSVVWFSMLSASGLKPWFDSRKDL
jgi:hypothetical protein